MARLPYLDKKDLAPEHQDLLDRPINLNRILVNSPEARRAGQAMGKYLRYDSKIEPRLRELAILQVGYLARAAYEWSHHIKIGHEFGVSDEDIADLIKDTDGKPSKLDDKARTSIKAAREMTLDGAISEQTFNKLQSFLDNAAIIDLVYAIAHYNGIVRLLASLQVDVEPEYQPYLDKFPLPK
jgi:alkylhydroperoxidase family enzyme